MLDDSADKATQPSTLKSSGEYHLISSLRHHFLPETYEPTHKTYLSGGLLYAWSARGHRKGIAPQLIEDDDSEHFASGEGLEKGHPGNSGWTIHRQRTRWIGCDVWDISWWVSILFVVGSIFWCINGVLFFVYFDASSTDLHYSNSESATAFLGGTLFIFGAYLGFVESLNPTRDLDFGWEVDELAKTIHEPKKASRALGRNRHHFGRHHPRPSTPSLASTTSLSDSIVLREERDPWKWWGTYKSVAYIANAIQLFGASIFFVSVLCGLPGVLPLSGSAGGPEQSAASEGLWLGLYWGTQVIGAPCFVIAGIMFCLEVQQKWYKPNIFNIGWQIGFWNAVGGAGFFFCGLFGIWRQTSIGDPSYLQKWGSAFSTFWGSWAFLLGSYIQLWEGINKRT